MSLFLHFSPIWKSRTKLTTAHTEITGPLTSRSGINQAQWHSVSLLLASKREGKHRTEHHVFWKCSLKGRIALAMLPTRDDGNRKDVLKTKLYKILANLQSSCSSYRSVECTPHAKEPQRINGNSTQEYRVTSGDCRRPKLTRKGENLH